MPSAASSTATRGTCSDSDRTRLTVSSSARRSTSVRIPLPQVAEQLLGIAGLAEEIRSIQA